MNIVEIKDLIIYAVAMAFLAIGFYVIWRYQIWERKRIPKLRKWAKQHGYSFQTIWNPALRDVAAIYPSTIGYGHEAKHVVMGEVNGRKFMLFDWTYTWVVAHRSGPGYCRVIVMQNTSAQAPLSIQSEKYSRSLRDRLGEEVEFESAEFNEAFDVKCANRRFASNVIDPQMMAWLLEQSPADWHWRGTGVIVRHVGQLDDEFAQELLDEALGFIERIPRHVTQDRAKKG